MLETTRLSFRDFVLGDFDAVHGYASDPLVTRYISFGPNAEAETRDFLCRMAAEASEAPRKNHTFAVIQSSSQRLIGGCGLDLADAVGPQYVLGLFSCRLLGSGHRRRGGSTRRCVRLQRVKRLANICGGVRGK